MKVIQVSSALLLSTLLPSSHGHGCATYPSSRNGGNAESGGSGGDVGNWCQTDVLIPGEPTLFDRDLLTVNPDSPPDYDTSKHPWRAPGYTDVNDYSCGSLGGRVGAQDGRDLAVSPNQITVTSPGTIEVGWAINANHGGGYAWRLCPKNSEITEECFQQNTLHAEPNSESWIQHGVTGSRTYIPVGPTGTMRTTNGTFPVGAEFTKNPIPFRYEDFPNPRPSWMDDFLSGDGYGPFAWSIWDAYQVPAGLASGEYLLSFRWDCEFTAQVWLNCADINIVGDGPAPSPTSAPPTNLPPTSSPELPTCSIANEDRKECGFFGVDEQECYSSGCCWEPILDNPNNYPWCYEKI